MIGSSFFLSDLEPSSLCLRVAIINRSIILLRNNITANYHIFSAYFENLTGTKIIRYYNQIKFQFYVPYCRIKLSL
jgi:hypothetical protein